MTEKEKLIKGNMCNSAIYEAGFQKGKLEQKKEIKEFIKQEEADIKQLITDFKNEGYLMLDFIKDFIEVRRDRIKQLSKEIGEEKWK